MPWAQKDHRESEREEERERERERESLAISLGIVTVGSREREQSRAEQPHTKSREKSIERMQQDFRWIFLFPPLELITGSRENV